MEILGVSEIPTIAGVNRLSLTARNTTYEEITELTKKPIEHAGITYPNYTNIDSSQYIPSTGVYVVELSQTPASEIQLRADVDFLLIMVEG